MIQDDSVCATTTDRLSHKSYSADENKLLSQPAPAPGQTEPVAIFYDDETDAPKPTGPVCDAECALDTLSTPLNVSCTYGNIDVTNLACAAFFRDTEIQVPSAVSFNSLFTDVSPGVPKFLVIRFLEDDIKIVLPEARQRDYFFQFGVK